jgi:hypothetical protein
MKKRIIVVMVVAASLLFLTQAAMAAYDAAQAKAIMQDVVKNFKALNAKAAAKDYYGAAEKFMDIARIFKSLEAVTPPKGEKAEWDRIHGGIVKAAFKGIGACGAQDDAGIKQASGELVKLRDEGHKMFM